MINMVKGWFIITTLEVDVERNQMSCGLNLYCWLQTSSFKLLSAWGLRLSNTRVYKVHATVVLWLCGCGKPSAEAASTLTSHENWSLCNLSEYGNCMIPQVNCPHGSSNCPQPIKSWENNNIAQRGRGINWTVSLSRSRPFADKYVGACRS